MRFLIKDLSKMTNFSPARIRKWQERYSIFDPSQGSNGYWYYTNEDYRVLRAIQQRLAQGKKLARIMQMGRHELLSTPLGGEFSEDDWRTIQLIKDSNYARMAERLDTERRELTYGSWMRRSVQPLCTLVGRAWESGFITIAEEHAFSRWVQAYLHSTLADSPAVLPATWLVAVFPDDQHELGALMHYCLLRARGRAVRFTGMLPMEELKREISTGQVERLSLSVVMPVEERKIHRLRNDLLALNPHLKIYFGGYGIRTRARRAEGAA